MASSVDGKIGPAGVDRFVSITSQRDLLHLQEIRDQADGILFGAETFRTWPKVHAARNKHQHAQHFILSRSLRLDLSAPLFQEKSVLVTLFSPNSLPEGLVLPGNTSLIQVNESPGMILTIVNHIKQVGMKNLLVEGGGRVLNQFLSAGVLDELYLTLSPQIIADANAPGLTGNTPLDHLPTLQMLSKEQHKDEVFLHVALKHK